MANAWIIAPRAIVAANASSIAAGTLPTYVGNDHMGVVWASNGGTNFIIDLGADVAVDTISLLGLTGAQPGWQWRLAASTAAQGSSFAATVYAGGWETLIAGAAMPVNGRGRSLWQAPGALVVARHWRVEFQGLSGANVTIARAVLGQRIQLARNFRFGGAFGVRDLGSAEFSRRAVLLRTRGAKMRSVGLSFGHVHRDEVEAVVHPLIERLGATESVLLVTDPAADAQRQNRMYFGPMVGDLGTVWARANGFEWSANVIDLDAVLP